MDDQTPTTTLESYGGHDILTQTRIHSLCRLILADELYTVLYIPVIRGMNINDYTIDQTDLSVPIYLGNPNGTPNMTEELYETLCHELTMLWITLWKNGFAAWEFELFLQPNGRVAFLRFDRIGFRMTRGPVSIEMGPRFTLKYFFQNPCFPHDFVMRLRNNGFTPPADCLPEYKDIH